MKLIIACLLLSFSILGFTQSSKQVSMKKELTKVNDYYQGLYSQSAKIDQIFKKIVNYRSNPDLGLNEYANPDEIEGLEWFEVLQKQRDEITLSIYKDYQSADYVTIMDDYNKDRKFLRMQLAKKQISWRQFVDDLQTLIKKMQAQEKLFWEKNPTIERAMVQSITHHIQNKSTSFFHDFISMRALENSFLMPMYKYLSKLL